MLESIWYAITLVGTPELWAIIAALLVLVYFFERLGKGKRHPTFKRFVIVFVISLALFLAVAGVIKTFYPMQRPCLPCPGESGQLPLAPPLLLGAGEAVCNPYCPTDPSFPSGHAGSIFVLFTALGLVFRKKWMIPALIMPALVAASRAALGVHTVLDVLVGAALGIVLTAAAFYITRKMKQK